MIRIALCLVAALLIACSPAEAQEAAIPVPAGPPENVSAEDARTGWQMGMSLLQAGYMDEAFLWVAWSADAGDSYGFISRGVMLAAGQGTPQNLEEARLWYRRAAERGSAHAHRALAGMYITGEGGPIDTPLGFALLDLAVAGGDEMAPRMAELFPQYGFVRPDEDAIAQARDRWLDEIGLQPGDIGETR